MSVFFCTNCLTAGSKPVRRLISVWPSILTKMLATPWNTSTMLFSMKTRSSTTLNLHPIPFSPLEFHLCPRWRHQPQRLSATISRSIGRRLQPPPRLEMYLFLPQSPRFSLVSEHRLLQRQPICSDLRLPHSSRIPCNLPLS